MQLLDLPIDVFRIIVSSTVIELGLRSSMRARLTCHLLADEIPEAVITTGVINDVIKSTRMVMIEFHQQVITRYLHHQVSTKRHGTHPWILAIREVAQTLAQETKSKNDPARIESLERSACDCIAANRGSRVIEILNGDKDRRPIEDSDTSVNCLAVAAWIGDMNLVKSLYRGSDPLSLFGRPSWAAAAQGHLDILQFLLGEGALPYEPHHVTGPNFELWKTPIGTAAYMGQRQVLETYLQLPYYRSQTSPDGDAAVLYAAYGNQTDTLRMALDWYKRNKTEQEFLYTLDGALTFACMRGAPDSARLLLDYGADVNETDTGPRSCLQLAAKCGSAPIVKMLLDAGASIEATNMMRRRAYGTTREMRRHKDALTEARRRGFASIVKLIEEKKRELDSAS